MGKPFEGRARRHAAVRVEPRRLMLATALLDADESTDSIPKHLESFKILNENMIAYIASRSARAAGCPRENQLDGLPGPGRD